MKVLIVAKTRRGTGACVGGITETGRSVRLVAEDPDANSHAGMEYEVGEVWEIESESDRNLVPPHVENIIVLAGRRLRIANDAESAIRRFMPPLEGEPHGLFDGLVQTSASGALFIAQQTGVPQRSTMFWVPDQPLQLDSEGKRLRYRYPTADGGCTITYVGFQEPLPVIPARTLLRVSLAHWWRPKEVPEEELRCFVQLSGWFTRPGGTRPPTISVRSTAPSMPPVDFARVLQVLKSTFGFSTFLPLQEDVVRRVLERKDSLAIMPTGGGKSLCYQLPALLFEGLTVVVSPLIALMQDQVRQLEELEIAAAFLNSTVVHGGAVKIAHRVRQGQTRLLFAAPETLLRPEILVLLDQSRVACLAIDEAHCISEWGHDFRPEYRQVKRLRERFPQAVCLALTATATPRVRQDIRNHLGIPPEGEFVGNFNRPNLFLSSEPRQGDGMSQMAAFLERHQGESGIIYCATRKGADEISATLTNHGWLALPYHAGLETAVRQQNQHQFIHDQAPLIVATIAFGMGINKPDIRFVAHRNLPKDLDSYYQEIGRAGRDGLNAECLLLYSQSDLRTSKRFIDEGAASERQDRLARLKAMMTYAQAVHCRRIPLLAYFGDPLGQPCGHCDNCGMIFKSAQPSDTVTTEPPGDVDVTESARHLLDCIRETRQIFGIEYIIDVLRASRSKKVLRNGHDRLKTYGLGKQRPAADWRSLATQFIRMGLIERDPLHGGLRLAPGSAKVFGGEPILVSSAVFKPTPPITKEQPGKDAKPSAASPSGFAQPSPTMASSHSQALFELLRSVRRRLAEEAKVPAYFIFSDRTLLEMAAYFPQTEVELLNLHGVGQVKVFKYAPVFLPVIRTYCQDHGISSQPHF